jgi:hypothetical protein
MGFDRQKSCSKKQKISYPGPLHFFEMKKLLAGLPLKLQTKRYGQMTTGFRVLRLMITGEFLKVKHREEF